MKRLLFLIPILLIGCKTVYVPVESVRIEKQIIRDTIIDVRLDVIHDSVSVLDTFSYLANKYSYSYASFINGRLNHSLSTKDVKIPVEVRFVEKETIDTIQVPYQVVKEVNRLTDWQKTQIKWFWFLIAGFAAYFLWSKRAILLKLFLGK